MQIVIHPEEPNYSGYDLVAVGMFAGEAATTRAFGEFDRALAGALSQSAADHDFTGKNKQQLVLNTVGRHAVRRVAFFGLGPRREPTADIFLRFGGSVSRLSNAVGAKNTLLMLPGLEAAPFDAVGLAVRGAELGTYTYTEYKSDKGRTPTLKKMGVHIEGLPPGKESVRRAQIVSQAVATARTLINRPPLDLYPETYADEAKQLAQAAGLRCQIMAPDALKKMGMNLLLGVGQGSTRPPRLVHLTYTPKPATKGKAAKKAAGGVALVGKGITFDSGGLALKPLAGMLDMKVDMAGSAAVLCTMLAVAQLKPSFTVHGIMALAENMPSGSAIRPGDVITSANGKTVEITNTDAEGRLVLADALHYALEYKPDRIIDIATLTGACMVALGPSTAGLFSNNDALAQDIQAAGNRVGEDFWRMPLTAGLKDQLKSDVADLRNSGDRNGGAIIASLFLKEFVGTTAWAHLDIAGPATTHEDAGAHTKGATGVGVATLVELIMAAS